MVYESLRRALQMVKILNYKHCFCYLNVENAKQKNSVSPANSSMVGITTIGDVTASLYGCMTR